MNKKEIIENPLSWVSENIENMKKLMKKLGRCPVRHSSGGSYYSGVKNKKTYCRICGN